MDDFGIFAKSFNLVMKLKEVTFALLRALGLQTRTYNGYHITVHVGDHLRMTIDMKENVIRAPKEKLDNILVLAKQLLTRFAKNKR